MADLENQNSKKNAPDVSHLAARAIEYIVPAGKGTPERKYRVQVSYSNHCWTRGEVDGDGNKTGRRVFDQVRYDLSKQLPAIIGDLVNRKCSFALDRNFFTVDIQGVGEYEVYFIVAKNVAGEITLHVQSAYVRDDNRILDRPRWRTIRFSVILFNVMRNKPTNPPRQ
jgi:hypothetical protein